MIALLIAWLGLHAVLPVGLAAAQSDEEAAPARQVTVRLLDYRFEPSEIVLKAGEPVELTLINDGTVLHEFVTLAMHDLEVEIRTGGVISETLGLLELELEPKSRVQIRFTPEKSGSLPFTCQAKKPTDHFKAGMAGTLTIR
ncbi:MAG: cupredoxin domain-containing protein [Nitrospirota bacterium]